MHRPYSIVLRASLPNLSISIPTWPASIEIQTHFSPRALTNNGRVQLSGINLEPLERNRRMKTRGASRRSKHSGNFVFDTIETDCLCIETCLSLSTFIYEWVCSNSRVQKDSKDIHGAFDRHLISQEIYLSAQISCTTRAILNGVIDVSQIYYLAEYGKVWCSEREWFTIAVKQEFDIPLVNNRERMIFSSLLCFNAATYFRSLEVINENNKISPNRLTDEWHSIIIRRELVIDSWSRDDCFLLFQCSARSRSRFRNTLTYLWEVLGTEHSTVLFERKRRQHPRGRRGSEPC